MEGRRPRHRRQHRALAVLATPAAPDKPLYCETHSHGCNMPGGFAEYVLINHDKVFAISDKLSFEEATFTEPTACAVHGVDRIAPGASATRS